MTAADHNHLDSMRRPPGECPGCDAAWTAQKERLAAGAERTAIVRKQERMADRPPPTPPGQYCTANEPNRTHARNLHVCVLRGGHRGPHWCASCEKEW